MNKVRSESDGIDCSVADGPRRDVESTVQSAAHIEAIARQAWASFCNFREGGCRVTTVANFLDYTVQVSIKSIEVEHDAKHDAAD